MSVDHNVPDPLVGTSLAGTYVIGKMIGEGGMGRVYQASHTRIHGKRFAIKVLSEEYANDHEALERFKREAEAAALISSPNVVGVHDYGRTPDGRPFLVCDFLEGEELDDRLKREGQLPVGEAVGIVRQVCAGLAIAHANGVTHRDIKPENVFLVGADDHLTAILIDFGISRFREGSGHTKAALTQAGVALGTPDFMSPEQAKGNTVDHRADIYGVGILLYVTITGVMPFERDTPHATLLALLTEDAPAPRALVPDVPEHLEMIIQKAMAKDPAERYGWIAELNQALAPYDSTRTAQQAAAPAAPAAAPAAVPAVAPAPAPPVGSEASDAASARPWLLVGMLLGLPALVLAAVLAVGGVLQAADTEIGAVGWILCLVGVLVVLSTPLVLLIRHVAQTWSNTARATELSRVLRAVMFAAAGSYALATLWLRVGYGATIGDAESAAWPLWDLVLLLVAVFAGLIAFFRAKR